jgi:hypothetical protein
MDNNKKYELTNECITVDLHKLYRIKSLQDFSDVRAGDLGGFLEKELNLAHEGNCWVYDDAKVYGNAYVYSGAKIKEQASLSENAHAYGNAVVSGIARMGGYSTASDNAIISYNIWLRNHEHITTDITSCYLKLNSDWVYDEPRASNIYISTKIDKLNEPSSSELSITYNGTEIKLSNPSAITSILEIICKTLN